MVCLKMGYTSNFMIILVGKSIDEAFFIWGILYFQTKPWEIPG